MIREHTLCARQKLVGKLPITGELLRQGHGVCRNFMCNLVWLSAMCEGEGTYNGRRYWTPIRLSMSLHSC
jgi:hypothetical protein